MIPAATPKNSGRYFSPRRVNGRMICEDQDKKPCQFFEWHGKKGWKCRHILQAENGFLEGHVEYLSTREERKSQSRFKSFDGVVAFFENKATFEMDYLRNMTLNLARSMKQVTTEDIYETVQGKFQADPRIVGTVVRSLETYGLIRKLRRPDGSLIEMRTRRKKNHGNKLKVWVLTDDGLHLFDQGAM